MKIGPKKSAVHIRDAGITLLNAMQDPALFGPWFKEESTWRAWRTFLRALFGLPLLNSADRAIYQRYIGRKKTPSKQAREAWLVVGRRGGKSFVVALIAVFLACFRDYRQYLAPGERATIMCLAADRRQARVCMRYIIALLEGVPMLARMVQRMGSESVDLKAPVTIEVHTASFRSVRGYTVAAAILDEVAFWRSDESANPDTEIVNALLPAMTTIPGALLLGISSPYARRGALWERYEEHYGQDGDPVLVWQADTRAMNPTVSEEFIDNAYRDDPAAAAAEYGAQFRSDIESFLQPEWISGAVREGLHELSPAPGTSYTAFTDPSGGSNDSFTLAIAHNENGRLVLDVCRGRRPPFNPQSVVAEFAAVLKRYGLSRVTGDRYSGEWVRSAFQEHGIYYEVSQRTASEIYLEALPAFATASVQLLDNRQLLTELRQLERFTGAGRDRVDHPPKGHDDLAVSACGALLQAVSRAITAEEFERGAMTVGISETRAARDEHLSADLGLVLGDASSDANRDDSPFNERKWK